MKVVVAWSRYLGFHLRRARMGSKSGQVAQALGLLLQRHDAVLVKHDDSLVVSPGASQSSIQQPFFSFLTIFESC